MNLLCVHVFIPHVCYVHVFLACVQLRFFFQTGVRNARASRLLRLPTSHGKSTRFHIRRHGYLMLPGHPIVNHLQKHVRLFDQGKFTCVLLTQHR